MACGIRGRRSFSQLPAGAAQNVGGHLQIALQLRLCAGHGATLRFEKQFRRGEDALSRRGRAVAPGGIELAGLARVALVLREDGGQALAVLEADAGRRDQVFHGGLRRNPAVAHLLLNGLGQQLHQGQPPRHPAHAAVEAARQFVQRIAETLFQFGEKPALFEGALLLGPAQGAVQQQSFGFAHRPQDRFDGVPPQLLEGGDPLVAIDHEETVRLTLDRHDDDRRLLSGGGQRGQQASSARRMVDAEVFPAPVELVELQSHGRSRVPDQYGAGGHTSFAAEAGSRSATLVPSAR